MMKIAALGGALALAMTTASFAQSTGTSTTTPGMNNPASSGKAGSVDNAKPQHSTTTGSAMTKSNSMTDKTPGGDSGPTGQQSKPK